MIRVLGTAGTSLAVLFLKRRCIVNVGDRVVFIGPEFAPGVSDLRLGRRGVVTGREGCIVSQIGEEPQELVSVRFDGDDRDTVLSIDRIEEIQG